LKLQSKLKSMLLNLIGIEFKIIFTIEISLVE